VKPKLLEEATSSDIMMRPMLQERCSAFDALIPRV